MGLVHNPNVVSDGLVCCWDAANKRSYPGAGTTCTSPVNNVVSTLINTPVFNPSKGGYFEFDGTNDYLQVTTTSTGYDAINLTGTTISLFAWVSRYNDTGYNPLICKRLYGCPQYEFNWYHSSGYNTGGTAKLVFECGGSCGTVYSDTLSSVDQWRYVGATYDGTTVRFYVDGEAWGTASLSRTMSTSTDPLRIANNEHVDGTCDIAVAQIYNRVLTAAEVKQNYNATKGRFT